MDKYRYPSCKRAFFFLLKEREREKKLMLVFLKLRWEGGRGRIFSGIM